MAATTGVGDSILPMGVMIARFQAEHGTVTTLGAGAAGSVEELIQRFASGVADSSSSALLAITLNAAEFAHLYFPTSIHASGPYAQPPSVNWLLLEQNSLKGMARLLRDYGGRVLNVEGHRCPAEPKVEGENRIWEHCVLRILRSGGEVGEVRLFGSILERGGRYKLMSLANRL